MIVIVRGWSGSGKTTLCSSLIDLHPEWFFLDADRFNLANQHFFEGDVDKDVARVAYVREKMRQAKAVSASYPVVLSDGVLKRARDLFELVAECPREEFLVVELVCDRDVCAGRIAGDDHLLGSVDQRLKGLDSAVRGWESWDDVDLLVDASLPQEDVLSIVDRFITSR